MPECNRAGLMDFFQNHFNKEVFEESGYEPFVDVSEKFNGAIVELVRPVISAKEADAPTIVVNRRQLRSKPSRALCGVGKQTAKVIRLHVRCPIKR